MTIGGSQAAERPSGCPVVMNEPEPQLISAKAAFFEVYKADFAEIPQN